MKFAIIADIHGNLEAFQTILEDARSQNPTQYVCLGDIVGYNANPRECLQMIRSLDLIGCVKGNHDEYVSNNDEEMLGFNQHGEAGIGDGTMFQAMVEDEVEGKRYAVRYARIASLVKK